MNLQDRNLVSYYSLDGNSSIKGIFDIRWCAHDDQKDLGSVLKIGLSCVFMYSACPSIKGSICLGDVAHHLFICRETTVWIGPYFSHVLNVRIAKSNLEARYILFLSEKLSLQGSGILQLSLTFGVWYKIPFLDRCGHFIGSNRETKSDISFSILSFLERL